MTDTPTLDIKPYGLRGRAPVKRPPVFIALFVAFFGVVFIAFPVGTSWNGGTVFRLFTLPSVAVGLLMIAVALWMLVGTRDVLVKRGVLRVRYALGPLGFSVRLGADTLERLRVVTASKSKDASVHDAPYTLEARLSRTSGKTKDAFPLAEADDPSWLIAWCETLGETLRVPTTIAKDARRALEEDPDDGVERPPVGYAAPRTSATIPSWAEVEPGHVTLYCLLDRDAKRRTASYFGMGGFFMVLPVVTVWFMLSGGKPGAGIVLGIGSIVLLFVAIGLTMVGYAFLSRRDSWIIDVTNNGLLCTARHLGRTRSRSVHAGSVRDVSVIETGESWGGHKDASGRTVGGTPVKQVRIDLEIGPPLRLMTGCSDDSLTWARDALASALCLPDPDGEPSDDAPE